MPPAAIFFSIRRLNMAWARLSTSSVRYWGTVVTEGRGGSTREMLIRATGKPLDAAVFKAHLKARYLEA
jgi:Zn-dependent M32 family carboxypeptidase